MSTKRLLLVADDDADVCELVATALGGAGFRVDTVSCGRAALHVVRLRSPLLVVLDVWMPDLSGLEVCRAIKAAAAPARVLLMSSDATVRAAGLAAGADDFLAKPFSPRELVARVRARLTAAVPVGGTA